jgi:WD40 repeat protein
MGRFIIVLVLAAGIGGAAAWQLGLFDKAPGPGTGDNRQPLAVPVEQLGEMLYPPRMLEKALANQERHGADPVVSYGTLNVIEKMDACSNAPGQILFVGQEIPEGTAQVAGLAPLLQGRIYSALVEIGDSTFYKLYYRLAEGDTIGEHEMVALINPAKAIHGVFEKTTKLIAAEAEREAFAEISKEAQNRLELERQLRTQGAAAAKDVADAKLTNIKTHGDYVQKKEAAKLAGFDLSHARFVLEQHRVKNMLPVKTCVIKAVYKRTGEAVKELEPILQLSAVDRLTADGSVGLEYVNRLAIGKKVIVEPTREMNPLRVWRSHKKEITAVAVAYAGPAAEPLAASASEDGTVCLWDQKYAGPIGLFTHSHPVKSLACSPREAKKHWLVAGLSDGSIAVWELDDYKSGARNKPYKLLKGPHADAVTALAFSPDGQFFASGSTDGSIFMWEAKADAESKSEGDDKSFHRYPFDAAHGVASPHSGPVTALHFTPQSTLVSAARDNTLRVWELHQKGAVLVGDPHAGRSGGIGALGVSRDGSTMLFDQGKALQFLSPDGRAVATLQNPSGTVPFLTLAEFAPDASLVLTAGAADGRLQLWKAPTDGKRGYEVRQFVTSEKSDVTSAAFFDAAPGAAGEIPFAVSGAKDGVVYLWQVPTREEVRTHRIDNVILTQIYQGVETRQIRIGVEVPNRDGRLIPGQPVTIVIE